MELTHCFYLIVYVPWRSSNINILNEFNLFFSNGYILYPGTERSVFSGFFPLHLTSLCQQDGIIISHSSSRGSTTSTLRLLAYSTLFHSFRFFTNFIQFFTLIIFKSFNTSSSHILFDLPPRTSNWFYFVDNFDQYLFLNSIYMNKPTKSWGFYVN